jgi:hypothetical protein
MIRLSQIFFFICFRLFLFGNPNKLLKTLGFGFSFILKLFFTKQ